MSNQWNYPEQHMYSQRNPLWSGVHLGTSSATIGGQGCVVTAVAYILSRKLLRDVSPLNFVEWCNKNGGFNKDGLLYWDTVRRFSNGALQRTFNPIHKYTCVWTNFAGINHLVVALRNPRTGKVDLMMNPWLKEGNQVQLLSSLPRSIKGEVWFS